jgi:radical SAM protein with 4Fe4S-binding SPASM domain
VKTLVRMEYRRRFGIPYDRRFRPGRSMPPTNVTLVPTYLCNLNCIMCRQKRNADDVKTSRVWYDPSRELQIESWVGFLDQIVSFRPYVYITGGEPLLYRHFEELVHQAKKRRLWVQIQTNATKLSGVADFLVDVGVEVVSISLDGPPAIHNSVRKDTRSFSRLEEGVRALVEARKKRRRAGPVLSFNFTISRSNFEHLEEVVDIASGMNADFLQVQHTMFNTPKIVAKHNQIFSPEHVKAMGLNMVLPSIGEGAYYQSEMTRDDIPVLLAVLHRARQRARGRINLRFMPNIPDELVPPYYLDLSYPFIERCNNFWKTLRVAPDGTVTPCLNFVVGNITTETFTEIWNGDMMRRLRMLFSRRLVPGCIRCCQRHFCAASPAL